MIEDVAAEGWNQTVALDDQHAVAAVSRAICEWEPSLDLVVPPHDALLFEPDGTLYAVQLREESLFHVRSRDLTVRRGDLVVVPRGQAVDAGTPVDLVGVRHDGPPPDHFRERFLQVWGVDLRRCPPPGAGAGLVDVVPRDDVRLRVPYAIGDRRGAVDAESRPLLSHDPLLLVGLDGVVEVSFPGDATGIQRVPSRSLLALRPGTAALLGGTGRVGILSLMDDVSNEFRRRLSRESGGKPSPEYRPDGNG